MFGLFTRTQNEEITWVKVLDHVCHPMWMTMLMKVDMQESKWHIKSRRGEQRIIDKIETDRLQKNKEN